MKNTAKTLLLVILAYLILPTGDPSDIFITAAIINAVGLQAYMIISIVLIYVLYKNIKGRTIKDKFNNIRKEIAKVLK